MAVAVFEQAAGYCHSLTCPDTPRVLARLLALGQLAPKRCGLDMDAADVLTRLEIYDVVR